MKKLASCLLLGALCAYQTTATAIPAVDIKQAPTGFFVPDESQTFDSPYYRWFNEDWNWTHGAIGVTYTTASLFIAAWDVDAPAENNVISVFDASASTWIALGSLTGLSDAWGYTTFDLTPLLSDIADEIATGLQVAIDIDTNNTSQTWAVSLAKSCLGVDQDDPAACGSATPGQAVPEIDAVSGTGALTLLIGSLAMVAERRRPRRDRTA